MSELFSVNFLVYYLASGNSFAEVFCFRYCMYSLYTLWYCTQMAPDVTIEELYNIQLYLEYQSVCPFVQIGSSPLYRKRVCPPPPLKQRGEATLARG
jgi:hypothetical protein